MRKLFLVILIAQTWVFSFAQVNRDSIKVILAAANSGFKNYLEKIPPGEESYFGFKSRNEFSLVQIGHPYHVVALKNEFYNANTIEGKDYLLPTGEWRIPLTVNGEYRVLLTVAKMKGIWTTVGIGSAMLAKELFEFEKKHPMAGESGVLLSVYKPLCDFILFHADNNMAILNAFPLASANMALDNNQDKSPSYTLSELLTLIKKKNITNK